MKTSTKLVAAFALLALAVVLGFALKGVPKHRPSVAEVGSPEAFAMAGCTPRLFDGAPAIAVMFTQPLARLPGLGQADQGLDISGAGEYQIGRWRVGSGRQPQSALFALCQP
jgi:hypothetical protein